MTNTVLTQEELDSLKSIQEQGTQLTIAFGQTEIAIINLNAQKEALKNALTELKQKEDQLASTLQTKYGTGNVNIETGEFTPYENNA